MQQIECLIERCSLLEPQRLEPKWLRLVGSKPVHPRHSPRTTTTTPNQTTDESHRPRYSSSLKFGQLPPQPSVWQNEKVSVKGLQTNEASQSRPSPHGSPTVASGCGVGLGVGLGVGRGVGLEVGLGVGLRMGLGVGRGVGCGVGLGVVVIS